MVTYWEIAAQVAYNMFTLYKYLIINWLVVNLVFPHSCFWSGNFLLFVPFAGHCLLLPFFSVAVFQKRLETSVLSLVLP